MAFLFKFEVIIPFSSIEWRVTRIDMVTCYSTLDYVIPNFLLTHVMYICNS